MNSLSPKITDLASLKLFFAQHVSLPIFGVGVYTFDRLGLEGIVPNFRLIALRYSDDTRLIERDVEVLALEKGMGTHHINARRNSTTVLRHPRTQEYLSHFNAPALLVYKASSAMEHMCQQRGWTLVAAPTRFGKTLFENKATFRGILENLDVAPTPGEIVPFARLDFKTLQTRWGLPFVLQHPLRGGGKGTFFIRSYEDWRPALEKLAHKEANGETTHDHLGAEQIVVTRYINGPSLSIIGCVTRHGILSTAPQYQIIDAPDLYAPRTGSGLFCGHDWSASNFSPEVEQQAYATVEIVGQRLRENGYKGIFGIDFVLDSITQKLFVTECNPRLTAAFPTLTMAQLRNQEPPLLAFHLLEHLGIDYEADIARLNTLMRQGKEGAQMFPHNLTLRWTKSTRAVRAGVYTLIQNDSLQFMREGYTLNHLESEDEFLLTDGILPSLSPYSPNRRLGRVLTLGGLLANDKKTLTPRAKAIARAVYAAFQLHPVRFTRIRRFFFPSFMAKG